DQVRGHRGEVIMCSFLALANSSLVPSRTEFAAAADVGDHIKAAAFEPCFANVHRIARKKRDEKAAITVQDGRCASVKWKVLGADMEIGGAHAVVRNYFVQRDGQAGCIKLRRQLLERLRRPAPLHNVERCRLEKTVACQ